MPAPSTSPGDRAAATLANLPAAAAAAGPATAWPSAGAADCRIDLKLLQWRAMQAMAASAASRAHLAAWPAERHPDLWAGTVQDGVARGFAARLEEAIALAPAAAERTLPIGAPTVAGKDLRKRKDLLVKSGGARVRFTRKEGVLFVDRGDALHSANCLRFEARADRGTLDGFVGADDERPRLFSAQFLPAVRYVDAGDAQQLTLAGRVGRGPIGWDCEATFTGFADEPFVRLRLVVDNRLCGWRLRARFLGLPAAAIAHACTPVGEAVANDSGGFVAFTLVRAVDRLTVGDGEVAVPGAACRGPIAHTFRLGGHG